VQHRNLSPLRLFDFKGNILGETGMLNDDMNRRADLNRRDNGMGGMMIAALVVAAVLIGLFMWAPWSGDRTASNTSPGTTVGSSASRPAAPAPGAPAAPSTTR
jgi:hypothetical protein